METVLIVIHLMVVAALVVVVLLQRSEGGALGIGGGGGSGGGFMTGRGQASALTRATAVLAAIFFLTSIGLTIIANTKRSNKSIFERPASGQSQPGTPAKPAAPGSAPATPPASGNNTQKPSGGTLFDQLKRQGQGAGTTPGAPAAPAAPTPPAAPATPPAPAAPQPPSPPAQGGN